MLLFLFILSFVLNFIAISIAIPTITDTYRRYQRAKLVICPEKKQEATIAVSPKVAATTVMFVPDEIRVIRACSLWPYAACSKACTAQLR